MERVSRDNDAVPRPVVVTGASGPLGRDLTAIAIARNLPVTVISRDPSSLTHWANSVDIVGWTDLDSAIPLGATVVHLAAKNNDARGIRADYDLANVTLTQRIADAAAVAGAHRLIFASSTRAERPRASDFYGMSKGVAEHALRDADVLPVTVIRLPALHDGEFTGRLRNLGKLPRPLQPIRLIGAFRSELDRKVAAAAILDLAMTSRAPRFEILHWGDNKDANPWYRIGKRALDLTAAIFVLTALSWLLALIWIIVRVDSPGPGLFVQERIGRRGQRFRCFKFRTMADGTPSAASHLVSRSSVTRFGRFLRRSKLDELPQAMNLLRNEMSLVGPRPCLPSQERLVRARSEAGILELKPGITGWAQINDVDMSDIDRLVAYDDYYRVRRNLIFEVNILLATVRGKGLADRTAD